MSKKKRNKKKAQAELDLLKPVNIMELGSSLDCFGREYDLSTDECKRCGDSEFCAIACSANLNIERKELEQNTEFKDIAQDDPIKKFILKKLERGTEVKKIVPRVVKRFDLDKKEARKLVKKYAQN